MTTRFNLYDFLAYLIPGFALLLFAAIALHGPLGAYLPLLADLEFFASAILFVASYLTGHLINLFRDQIPDMARWREQLRPRPLATLIGLLLSWLRPKLFERTLRTHQYSVAFLSDDGKAGTDTKISCRWALPNGQREAVRRSLQSDSGIELDSEHALGAAWYFARAVADVHGVANRAEVYNANASLLRNLTIVFRLAPWLAILMFALEVIAYGAFWSCPLLFVKENLGEAGVFLVAFLLLGLLKPMAKQYELFERLFAKEVLFAYQAAVIRPAGENGA